MSEAVENSQVVVPDQVQEDAVQDMDDNTVSVSEILSESEEVVNDGEGTQQSQSDSDTTTENTPSDYYRSQEEVNKAFDERFRKEREKYAPDQAIAQAIRAQYEGKSDQEILDDILDKQAEESGFTKEQLRFMKQNGYLQQPQSQQQEAEESSEPEATPELMNIAQQVMQDTREIQKTNPNFNPQGFLRDNPRLSSAIESGGMSLAEAYSFNMFNQQQAQSQVNAYSEPPPVTGKTTGRTAFDANNMTDEQYRKIVSRLEHGEYVRLE